MPSSCPSPLMLVEEERRSGSLRTGLCYLRILHAHRRRAALKEKEQTNGHLKISAKPWGVLHRKMRSLNPPHTEGYDLLSMELSLVGFE